MPREFDVASIRPSTAAPNAGTSFNVFEGGRIRIVNEPVKLLIRTAFQLQDSQIAGGPAWIDTDRYDLEAKTGRPEKPGPGQISPMLQSLLAERFQLKFHREMRELPVGALVLDRNPKNAEKLKPAAEDESAAMNTHGGKPVWQLAATSTQMPDLARYVGNRLGRIVLDRTGLTGRYNFSLQWTTDDAPYENVPTLIESLRELGLKLESQKGQVEVLVIDNIQRPSEN